MLITEQPLRQRRHRPQWQLLVWREWYHRRGTAGILLLPCATWHKERGVGALWWGWVRCSCAGSGEERDMLAPRCLSFRRDSEISTFRHAMIGEWVLWVKPVGVKVKPLNCLHQNCLGVQIQIPGSYSRPAESDLWDLGDRKQHWAIFINSFQLKNACIFTLCHMILTF